MNSKFVDLRRRREIAKALSDYLDGAIDNFALNDVLFIAGPPADHDLACHEISSASWYLYDDCRRHRNGGKHKLTDLGEQAVRRWIALLNTSEPWNWERCHTREWKGWLNLLRAIFQTRRHRPCYDNMFWPWADETEWKQWAREHGFMDAAVSMSNRSLSGEPAQSSADFDRLRRGHLIRDICYALLFVAVLAVLFRFSMTSFPVAAASPVPGIVVTILVASFVHRLWVLTTAIAGFWVVIAALGSANTAASFSDAIAAASIFMGVQLGLVLWIWSIARKARAFAAAQRTRQLAEG